jgi:hypothetical protein
MSALAPKADIAEPLFLPSVRPGEHSVGTVARKPVFRGHVPSQTFLMAAV